MVFSRVGEKQEHRDPARAEPREPAGSEPIEVSRCDDSHHFAGGDQPLPSSRSARREPWRRLGSAPASISLIPNRAGISLRHPRPAGLVR